MADVPLLQFLSVGLFTAWEAFWQQKEGLSSISEGNKTVPRSWAPHVLGYIKSRRPHTHWPAWIYYRRCDLSQNLPIFQCHKRWWRAADYKLIVLEKMGLYIMKMIHRSSYMGPQRMKDLVCQSHIRIRDANLKTAKIVKKQKQNKTVRTVNCLMWLPMKRTLVLKTGTPSQESTRK